MSGAIWGLNAALNALLLSDPDLSALVGAEGVYSGVGERGAPLPYIVLGESSDERSRAFKRVEAGVRSTEVMHLWGVDKFTVLLLYRHISRLLSGTRLVITGYTHHLGKVQLITTLPDQDGLSYHGVVHYTSTLMPS